MTTEKFGAKGEWWVIAQMILALIVLVLDVLYRDSLSTTTTIRFIFIAVAVLCVITGAILLFAAVFGLGANLTALPRPIDSGHLVESGAYSIVRHPIYSGVIIGMFGVAFFFSNWIGLLGAAVIFVFFDQKSRREEVWLVEKYPAYQAYRTRVRKLIPFIY